MTTPVSRVTDELLPCPFCGGEAAHQTDTEEEDFSEEWIGCLECGATTTITTWNRRSLSSDSVSDGSKGVEPCLCDACRAVIEYDLLVDDGLWAKIAPKPVEGYKGGGVLCPSCILSRALDSGKREQPRLAVAWRVDDMMTDGVTPAGTFDIYADKASADQRMENAYRPSWVRLTPLYASPTEPKAGVVSEEIAALLSDIAKGLDEGWYEDHPEWRVIEKRIAKVLDSALPNTTGEAE